MPAKPLTEEQKQDAERLRDIFEGRQGENPSLTQESLAHECGWKTQGTVHQYMTGKIPLNLPALLKFSKALNVGPEKISPQLARKVADLVFINRDGPLSAVIEAKYTGEERRHGDRRTVEGPPGSYPVPLNKFREIPVIGKTMGGIPERIWDDGGYPVGTSDKYAEVATQDPHAFIVPVEGPSMIPRYNPGEFALVEPGTEPEIEDDVLVRFANDGTSLKRLLSRRGGYIRLGSYNTADIITVPVEDISWMYYVAHPVPARKIKTRT